MNSKTKRAIADAYDAAKWLCEEISSADDPRRGTSYYRRRRRFESVGAIRDLIRELRESEARVAFWQAGHARREAEWQKAMDRVRELESQNGELAESITALEQENALAFKVYGQRAEKCAAQRADFLADIARLKRRVRELEDAGDLRCRIEPPPSLELSQNTKAIKRGKQ